MAKKEQKIMMIKQSLKLSAETRRSQILNAAHKLFEKKGYRATTIDDIAENAGLTKGAVYYHFKNKESILKYMVKGVLDNWIDAFNKIPNGSLSPGQLLNKVREADYNIPMHKASHNLSVIFEIMQIPNIRKMVNEGYGFVVEACMKCLDARYVKSKSHRKQLAILVLLFYDGLCWAKNFEYSQFEFNKQAGLFASLFVPVKEKILEKGKSS